MSDESALKIGLTICRGVWKKDAPSEDESVEDVAKKAFRLVRNDSYTWFTTDDEVRFRIGIGLLLVHYKDTPTFELLQNTLDGLKALNALMQGIPVDLSAVVSEELETLPLLPWFKETAQ